MQSTTKYSQLQQKLILDITAILDTAADDYTLRYELIRTTCLAKKICPKMESANQFDLNLLTTNLPLLFTMPAQVPQH